jgi:hypothetical protein
VCAPLTFARRLTVNHALVLESSSLRFERRGVRAAVVDLSRPFALESKQVDDEVVVLVEQDPTRILFCYSQGAAFVTLPISPYPHGWVRHDERFTHFGEEAAIIHEQLRRLSAP